MAKKTWIINFDVIVPCAMEVKEESEDAARKHLMQKARELSEGDFCGSYGSDSMEIQEDTIEIHEESP